MKKFMVCDIEDQEKHMLLLSFLDESRMSSARHIEWPLWSEIDNAIEQAYLYGGFLEVRVRKPDDAYVYQLSMRSEPKQFRIIALTRDQDPKRDLLEWWEPEVTGFRGTIRFGDDDWDARTVSSDLTVARKFFRELFEHGKLSPETIEGMRSRWNPMPQ